MNDLRDRVCASIRERRLLRRGQAVVAAVSGGLDSMVLLDVLHALAGRERWRLTVAHLNHRLRGRSSDADERLVVRVAGKLGLAVVVERADVKEVARARKISIEMAAREVRHAFLAGTAARLNARTVAMAHHADDQVELFFLRLCRGTGGEGLGGMKWRGPSPADRKVELVRPLLDQPKAVLRQYAEERGVLFRDDATNALVDARRNRIRNELLPLLRREYQPAIDRAVWRLMRIAGAEAEVVGRLADDWLAGRNREAFERLPVAVQRRCIQAQLFGRGVDGDYDLVERLRLGPGRAVTAPGGVTVVLERSGRLAVRREAVAEAGHRAGAEMRLAAGSQGVGAGAKRFGAVDVCWRIGRVREGGAVPVRRAGREFFDADKVGGKVVLRHWRSGDRFQPIGMGRPVKLQDLFTNLKIPRERRHELVVAESASGELFWVEGLRVSECFKLTPETIRRLRWEWGRR